MIEYTYLKWFLALSLRNIFLNDKCVSYLTSNNWGYDQQQIGIQPTNDMISLDID